MSEPEFRAETEERVRQFCRDARHAQQLIDFWNSTHPADRWTEPEIADDLEDA
jgi:hypothetical protein